ncbi:MAG: DUF4476 domain-containing protein, partial [Flammeovirgaceae bacterium]
LIVEDIFEPVVAPINKPTPTEVPIEMVPVDKPATVVAVSNACEMTNQQYLNAVKAIDERPFRGEKMDMALIVTKNKCLTNEQIRGIAQRFSFEDQTLQFVKYAYDLSTEKSTTTPWVIFSNSFLARMSSLPF